VVLDTATEFQRTLLQQVCDLAKVQVASQREWGIVLNLMDAVTRNLKQLPQHVIFLCHEMQKEDAYYGRTMYMPAFKGAYKEEYGRAFSSVFRFVLFERLVKQADGTNVQQIDRWLLTQRDQWSHAKDRFSCLERYELPNIDAIFDKINQSMTTALVPTQTTG